MCATIRHKLRHAKKAWPGTLIDHAFSVVNFTLCPVLMVCDNYLPSSPHFPLSLSLYIQDLGVIIKLKIPGVIAMTYDIQGLVVTRGDNLCRIRYFQIVE